MKAMNLLGTLLVEGQAYDRAIETYRTLLSMDNLLEEAHRELMRCYALKGDRVLALRQYHMLNEIMRDELGVSPSHETTRLFQSIQNNGNW
jgi:DNA-binding SARP family transcriptional activator